MSERTYGDDPVTLKQIDAQVSKHSEVFGDIVIDMAAHIRELQAEVDRFKSERREFGLRVADLAYEFGAGSVYSSVTQEGVDSSLAAIVEQELAK